MFVMRGLCVALCVVVCRVDVASTQLVPVGCDLAQIPVQPNFDVRRYVGRWQELMWVAPVEERAYDATDYYWQIHSTSTSHRGVLRGFQSGRDPSSGRCFGASIALNETDTPGVFLFTTTVNKYVTRYYVMDTDYDTYANTYGCYDYSSDGRVCYKGQTWLWARGSSLADHVLQRARQSWENLCLDLQTLLKVTPVTGHDCPFHG